MRYVTYSFIVLLVLPACLFAQDDENWPPLSYLRNDYKAVSVVAHIRIEEAEITNRVGGYENWKIKGVVLESFKGKFKKGEVIDYFHGAEAGFKREYFTGEKIVFLLAESDKDRKRYYAVLENSTLPYTADRVKKLRVIKRSLSKPRRISSLRASASLGALCGRENDRRASLLVFDGQITKLNSGSAALPLPLGKASGFPLTPILWRLGRPEAKPLLTYLSDERKAGGFPQGRRQSRISAIERMSY